MTERRKFRRRNPLSAQTAVADQADARATSDEAAAAAQDAERQRAALQAGEAERQAANAQLALEAVRAEDARRAEDTRKADTGRMAEEARMAEAAREAEEAREAKERHAAEEAQEAEQAHRVEAARPKDRWAQLASVAVDARHLENNRIVTAGRDDPAHAAFDVLRTRLLQALADHGWRRVAITSPTKDCGKTFTAANLAISLSRQENCRTLLIDCDLRRPTLHKVIGLRDPGSMGDVLRGKIAPEDHFLRMGENSFDAGHNIAFGFNGTPEPYASELLQSPQTAEALARIDNAFAPDVVLFDLPPALYFDDVIAFRPLFDGVLLVVGGGLTTDKEIREVERRLGKDTPLLGTVLNRAEGTKLDKYTY
ncbi:exopolysaccharide biosynthesis protein [Citreicella sp. C3M06]|uniref:CpsD/CapB family tyrosine-protein kinase n=1 Tax=Citreicella sp. C3M06 TaxID=2841564 RepID=UPI001C07F4F0|nr:CpsD/CapB family tyrosine-protein kinase [Citreicella sp. C3M06]MBU2959496.1 exopolysaccharide biosynthesis protein [Citreicella sp. C3M06]